MPDRPLPSWSSDRPPWCVGWWLAVPAHILMVSDPKKTQAVSAPHSPITSLRNAGFGLAWWAGHRAGDRNLPWPGVEWDLMRGTQPEPDDVM